jgi:UDP-N-acetylglucosamine 2-epimerase (non-hydrolysing)
MAPLVKKFSEDDECDTKVCVTGQHRRMLDQVLEVFDIHPDYDLDLMKEGQDLYDITSNVLLGLRDVLRDFNPDIVLVHGDTTTSSAAALAAFYYVRSDGKNVKIGHIEAGLRTGNVYNPWPEELNRKMTGVIANYHFAPTIDSASNLIKENIAQKDILITGNTVIDALFLTLDKIKNKMTLRDKIESDISEQKFVIKKNRKFLLVTGHRRESFGEKIENVCKALEILASSNPCIDIVYAVHPNPKVQEPVNRILSNIPNVFLIEPLCYESFLYLMDAAYFIITDSGGIQEEAPSLGKPVLVTRDTTERPEAVAFGTVKLVGTSTSNVVLEAQKLLDDRPEYLKMSESHNPYGDGNASKKIVDFIKGQL